MANTVTYRGVTYTQADMTVGTQYDVQSLDNRLLEVGTFSIEIETDDETIVNFTRNEPITYNRDGSPAGIYYVQNIKRVAPRTYRIDATTRLDILLGQEHMGGIYNAVAASQVITDICAPIPVNVDKIFAEVPLTGYLPIASKRDNLSKVLFRLGAALKTAQDGSLHVTALSRRIKTNIPATLIYDDDADVDYPDKVTRVVLTEHQYIRGTESVSLFDGTTMEPTPIKFSDPVFDLVATGFTVIESGANYAVISAGSGTLTGTKYIHQTREVSREVQSAPTEKVERVDDQTLVTILESAAILDRLHQYYLHPDRIQASVARQNEAAGDVVTIYHPYTGETVEGTIESVDADLSYTVKARESILMGFSPIDPNAGVFNRVELIDTAKDFMVPPGVHKLRAVIIQGGKGGNKGNPGSPAAGNTRQSISYSDEKGVISWPGEGGEGGEPGQAGSPGKISVVDIDVKPGQVIHAVPGVGGIGGKYADETGEGAEGTHSVFGEYSSESGVIFPAGWEEVLSGDIYATPGRPGIKGGKGSGCSSESRHPLVPGDPITVDGQTWNPGASYRDQSWRLDAGNYNSYNGYFLGIITGSQGGGAAYGAHGYDGAVPYVRDDDPGSNIMWGQYKASDDGIILGKEPPNDIVAAYNTSKSELLWGGLGATALPLPPETTIGTGGPGGNGGGGGGAPAAAQATNRYKSGLTAGRARIWSEPTARGAYGGDGSDGSDGGPGGIFVYYHVDEEEEGVSLP